MVRGWRYYSNCLSGATLGDPPPPSGADSGGGCLPVMRVMAPEAVWCPSLRSSLSPAPLTATLKSRSTRTAAINKALQSCRDELTDERDRKQSKSVLNTRKKSVFDWTVLTGWYPQKKLCSNCQTVWCAKGQSLIIWWTPVYWGHPLP